MLEICVESVASAVAAQQGGADRIEVCSALDVGGITPSLGLLRAVRARVQIGLHVLIRPRAGGFVYSGEELEVMHDDILLAKEQGVDGVVLGLLTADGGVDVERTAKLIAAARPMAVTFHRAVDVARDPLRALQQIMATGADRLLTSGGQVTALAGVSVLQQFVAAAGSRLTVMAGSGVRAGNVAAIAHATGATEWHASLRRAPATPHVLPGQEDMLRQFGMAAGHTAVFAEDVLRLRQALTDLESGKPV